MDKFKCSQQVILNARVWNFTFCSCKGSFKYMLQITNVYCERSTVICTTLHQKHIRNTEKKESEWHWKQRNPEAVEAMCGDRDREHQDDDLLYFKVGLILQQCSLPDGPLETLDMYEYVCVYTFNVCGCHCVKLAKIAFCGFQMCYWLWGKDENLFKTKLKWK